MTSTPNTPPHEFSTREPGDADMSGSGIEKTHESVAELLADEETPIDPELSSPENLERVREHYEEMTDIGATIKGEGAINGVSVEDE